MLAQRRTPAATANLAAIDAYDAFTLELQDVDVLATHVITRLEALKDLEQPAAAELAALVVIARHLRDRQRRLGTAADALLDAGDPVGARNRTSADACKTRRHRRAATTLEEMP